MGLGYELVNVDREERISFFRVNTGVKALELSGTTIPGSIITYYLLTHLGDKITFVDDHSSEFFLFGKRYTWSDFEVYTDVTDQIVEDLIKLQVIRDDGKIWIDEEENLYYRDLANIWNPKSERNK